MASGFLLKMGDMMAAYVFAGGNDLVMWGKLRRKERTNCWNCSCKGKGG